MDLDTAVACIQAQKEEIESLREQNEKCHELRLNFIDKQVTVINDKEKEIKSLRSDNEQLRIDLDRSEQCLNAVEQIADKQKLEIKCLKSCILDYQLKLMP